MTIERCILPTFTVIGREGSTHDGPGFIQKLWAEANAHFDEIAHLVKRDASGTPVGFWGAMTDFSRAFRPWENGFSEGLYLAGAECIDGAEPPAGWTKWTIPGFEYLKVENADFGTVLEYMGANSLALAGAVHDFTDPRTGKNHMLFPIRKLQEDSIMDLRISDLLAMQTELQQHHPEWGGTPPERGSEQLLWGIGEIGEVIDIIKKRGDDEIMTNPETRRHFVEEMADVFMYLTDVMLCYDITAEEYSEIHARKHARNMKRNYADENRHMFDGKD